MSSYNIKKIVITGSGGFLGSNLVEALKKKEDCYVYALSSRGEELQKTNACQSVRYCHKDALFSEEGEQILKDAIVVNCAFPRNSTGTEMAAGLQYIQRVFDRSKECGVKAIINISSQSVYSQTREEPATEKTPVCLESPYAVGKYATELMLESVCRESGIAYTNLRMASLIGPGFDQRIVNRLIKQALLGEMLYIVKSNQRFGFLDVLDAVRAILALLQAELIAWKPVYTVGNAEEYSIETIVQNIGNVFEKNGVSFPDVCIEMGTKSGSTGVTYKQIYRDIGFEPMEHLEDSIRRIFSALKRYRVE